jgi:activator of 2-hydroxyglutaryl-CoA dehydratase
MNDHIDQPGSASPHLVLGVELGSTRIKAVLST